MVCGITTTPSIDSDLKQFLLYAHLANGFCLMSNQG